MNAIDSGSRYTMGLAVIGFRLYRGEHPIEAPPVVRLRISKCP